MGDLKNNKTKLYWFWDYTTRYWFFPLFYLVLALLASIIGVISGDILAVVLLYFMPIGLLAWPSLFTGTKNVHKLFGGIGEDIVMPFFVIFVVGYALIIYQRYYLKKINKWLVILLILLILLAFLGYVIGNLTDVNFLGSI